MILSFRVTYQLNMVAKSTKPSKKEETVKSDDKLSMAAIASLLDSRLKVHQTALSADFRATISTLKAKLDRISSYSARPCSEDWLARVQCQPTGWMITSSGNSMYYAIGEQCQATSQSHQPWVA